MGRWREALDVYRDRGVATMLFLGFAAGLPLPLTGFTLRQRLSEDGIDLAAIGATALIGIAYSWKFVWSPALDQVRPPLALGRRRGWLLPIQLALAAAIAAMAAFDPRATPAALAIAAVAVAFLSASQDIVVDAYRIERLAPERQGAGLAAYIWGYRAALLAGNAGALWLAEAAGWRVAYLAMAALMAIGVITCVVMREAAAPSPPPAESWRARLRRSIVDPFRDFARRAGWGWILAFVALFKLGEALAGIMTAPFYRELGFSRIDVANVAGVFGLVATLAGVAVGGLLVRRLGTGRALVLTGLLQMLSNLMYVALARAGHSLPMLWAQVGVENFTDGLADAAFVAYLSGLTDVAFTATQYALLSSLAALPLRTLGATSGWLAQGLGWEGFFLLTTAAALPAMAIMLVLLRRFPPEPRPPDARPRSAPA